MLGYYWVKLWFAPSFQILLNISSDLPNQCSPRMYIKDRARWWLLYGKNRVWKLEVEISDPDFWTTAYSRDKLDTFHGNMKLRIVTLRLENTSFIKRFFFWFCLLPRVFSPLFGFEWAASKLSRDHPSRHLWFWRFYNERQNTCLFTRHLAFSPAGQKAGGSKAAHKISLHWLRNVWAKIQ